MNREEQDAAPAPTSGPTPAPALGALGSLAVVAGSMLGVGIFLTPATVAAEVSGPWAFLGLWAFGGLVALAGAGTYAELGALFPKAGGDYVFLRRVLGAPVGFAAGWVLVVGVFAGSAASMAAAVCQYQLPVLLGRELDATDSRTAALVLVSLLTLLNFLRVTVSSAVQIAVTLAPFLVLTGIAAWAVAGGAPAPDAAAGPGGGDWTGAFLGVYFAYAGWNGLAYVGGEVRNPGRNLPLGLVGGTLAVTLLYLLLCGAFLAVLGLAGVRGAFEAGTATAGALFGDGAAVAMAALIGLALLGSLNATVLQGSRMLCAMAEDRLLPAGLAGRDPRHHSPRRALAVQWAFTVALLLAGGFEALLAMTSIAMLLLSGLTVVALFVLRRRAPDRPRPYRALGYPVLPLLFLVVTVGVILAQGTDIVRTFLAGAVAAPVATALPLLGVGGFVLLWLARRLSPAAPDRPGDPG